MKSRFLVMTLLSSTVFISSCGVFNKSPEKQSAIRDRNLDYLRAEEEKRAKVPQTLAKQTAEFKDALPVPSPPRSLQPVSDEFQLPKPRPLAAELIITDSTFIQTVEAQQWLVLEASASQAWPKLLSFCEANNLTISFADPSLGIMETNWIDAGTGAANTLAQRINNRTPRSFFRPSLDRFQLRMEQGLRRGRTEIHITHMGVDRSLVANNTRPWPLESDSLLVERAVLDELKGHVDNQQSGGGAFSLAAQNIKLKERAELTSQIDGTPVLKLNLDFARAWISVGQALRNAFVPITDLNRDQAVYYVDISKQGQDPNEQEQRPDGLISKIIKDLNNEEEVPADIWQIRIKEERDGVSVYARKEEIAQTPKDTGSEILALIKEYAS